MLDRRWCSNAPGPGFRRGTVVGRAVGDGDAGTRGARSSGDKAGVAGLVGQFGARRGAHRAQQIRDMVADGEVRKGEAARDLFVRLFLREHRQHLDLPRGQRRRRGWGSGHGLDRRLVGFEDDAFALLELAQPRDDAVGVNRFGDIGIGAITHDAADRRVVVEHRHDRDRRAREAAAHHRQRLRGVHAGEQQVDGEQPRRGVAIGDAEHFGHRPRFVQRGAGEGAADELRQPAAKHRVIIGDDDAGVHRAGHQ